MASNERERNLAAWIRRRNQRPLEILDAEIPKVKPDHIIVRVRACAINPVDHQCQDHDIFNFEYPTILGNDVAGEVFDVGDNIPPSTFKKGDRVMALTLEGGFQRFTSCRVEYVSKIPDSISFVDAATLPVALTTAAVGLFGKGHQGLPLPSLHRKETSNPEAGKNLLVWGGSGSVGTAAIQLAAASGVNVITTASKRNHDLVRSLGANSVVDYSAANVDEELYNLVGSSNNTFVGVFDAISTEQSWTRIYRLLEQIGGGSISSVEEYPKDGPSNVQARFLLAPDLNDNDPDIARFLFGEFFLAALEKRIIKPAPPAHVVGKGLDKVQTAIDLLRKGVSGRKLVVEVD